MSRRFLTAFPAALLGTFFLATILRSSSALDMRHAEESPCFNISNPVPMDLEWVSSVNTWYYPMLTRFDLYRAVIDLSDKEPEYIRENEIYYDSCITWKIGTDGSFATRGFNGTEKFYEAKLLGANFEAYEFWPRDGKGNAGTCYTTLTDNRTFTFSAGCLTGSQMVFGVASSIKVLPHETINLIEEHAVSLGFKKEYFTGLRYDSCGDV